MLIQHAKREHQSLEQEMREYMGPNQEEMGKTGDTHGGEEELELSEEESQ